MGEAYQKKLNLIDIINRNIKQKLDNTKNSFHNSILYYNNDIIKIAIKELIANNNLQISEDNFIIQKETKEKKLFTENS